MVRALEEQGVLPILILQLFADPEVAELGFSVLGVDKDVVWLDVSVHLVAFLVQVVDTVQNLRKNR